MTNPDGRAYTLQELNEQVAAETAKPRGMAGPIDPADPWEHGNRVPESLDELASQLAKLAALTHQLFDRIALCRADPGDKPADETVGPKPTDYEHTSQLHQTIVGLGHRVRDLQQDVVYVTRRIEL